MPIKYCPHCKLNVADRTFRDHKLKYYDSDKKSWKYAVQRTSLQNNPREMNKIEDSEMGSEEYPVNLESSVQNHETGYGNVSKKTTGSIKDLQKGMYEDFFLGGDIDDAESGECEIDIGIFSSEQESDLNEVWEDASDESDFDCTADKPKETNATGNRLVLFLSKWVILFLGVWMDFYTLSSRSVEALLKFIHCFLTILGSFVPWVGSLAHLIPSSMHTLKGALGIQKDSFTKYVVCPDCNMLYNYDECLLNRSGRFVSLTCQESCFPMHPHKSKRARCGAQLLKQVTLHGDVVKWYPRKSFPYKSLKESLEILIAQKDFVSKCELWRSRVKMPGFYRDIYDGRIWREFQEVNGQPFLSEPHNLGLMMNIDWFQPHKFSPYSVGAIYLVIMNLPRELRFKTENVILVGILSGPKEVDADGLNQHLVPLVDELLELWIDGLTLQYPGASTPQKFRAALLCIASDIPAARKLCGFLSHAAKLGCSRCTKEFKTGKFGEKTDYSGFERCEPRKHDTHVSNIRKTRKAKSMTARAAEERKTGSRYTELGTLRVWSLQSPGIEKKEVKGLDLKPDTQGVIAEQLTMTLALDVDKWDFKFQSGPFAEQSGGAPAGPSTAAFYPSLSVFGTQNSLAIALDNNDILKCNTEEPFYETPSPDQEEDFKETPKIIHQNLRGTDNNSIGENIPAELFRDHKHPVLLLGFIDNVKNMVSVDNKGHIYIWRYTRREISSYEWFQPYKKYRLDMSKTMYTPATNSKPTVIFSDKTQTGRRHKTKQQIFKDREATENSIAHLNLKNPFHIDMIPEQEMATYIYAPDEHVSEAGSVFHIIIRRLHSNQLSSYLTRAYRPVKIKCERLVSCLQTPDGSELVFVLLFPEYPPKEAHLTVVRVDLKTMKVLDCRLDIIIEDDDQYLRCLRDDVVSCAVTRTLGATGAPYLCVNIEGNISFYSLVTGQEVVTTQRQNEIFNGLTVNLQSSPISAKTEMTVADYDGRMFVFFYTSDQKEKKLCRKLTVLELEDENSEEIRENMRVTFNTWNEHPPAQPLSNTITDVTYDTDTLHPAAYARGLIMELVDDMIQRRDGPYTEEMLELFREMDAVRNYTALGPEIERQRTPLSRDPTPFRPDTADEDILSISRPQTNQSQWN